MNTTQLLSNVRVLVTRPQHQAHSFIRDIKNLGGQTFHLPTIEIVFSNRQADLSGTDLLIFTSVNAVIGAQLDTLSSASSIDKTMVAAIGTATASALREAGVKNIICPRQNGNSESLLELLKPHIDAGMKVTIIRGESGRNTLRERLQTLGAYVRYVQTYQRKLPDPLSMPVTPSNLWSRANPNIVSVSSDLGLANLITLLPTRLHQQVFSRPLVVNSVRCMKKARAAGFDAMIAVADPPGDRGQIDQLCAYAQTDSSKHS